MPYYVDFLEGNQASVRSYPGRALRIGRGTNMDLRFDDASVSLEHAVIEQSAEGWTIRDRGSVTGTFVNDGRVETVGLRDGDRIEVGVYRLKVEVLSQDDPLFLHAARIGDLDEEPATLALNTFRVESGDLLAMVETTRRLKADAGSGSGPEEPASDDSFMTLAATLLLGEDEEAEPPLPEPPAAAPVESPAPPAAVKLTTLAERRPAAGREAPAVDYARAYRLERGLVRKSAVTALLSLLTAGGLLALFERGLQDVFSPGPLTSIHRSVTNNACGACHSGWRPVAEASCQSSNCHDTVGAHQANQLREPSCLDCHTEHRDLQALRLLLADGGCVACHRSLRTLEGDSEFAKSITGFGSGEHPGFTPRTDPGALEFHHAWHLTKVKKNGVPVLACEDCHTQNERGEVDPVVFEEHCQECHNLAFDPRFGSRQAPHVTPAEVLTYLAGFYSLRPEVLGRLNSRERRRLLGGPAGQEEQLAVVADENARMLLRTKCLKCHHFTAEVARSSPSRVEVIPVRLRDRWLEHAAFSHTPHLELDMSCDDCHLTARSSREASDVLLPEIDGCRNCHRRARPGESPATATLGRVECMGCHTYHPEPREVAMASISVAAFGD